MQKHVADLQGRIFHGAIAWNRHRAHLDPSAGVGCPFCNQRETLEHLVVQCPQLDELLGVLKQWVEALQENFTVPLFVYGLR